MRKQKQQQHTVHYEKKRKEEKNEKNNNTWFIEQMNGGLLKCAAYLLHFKLEIVLSTCTRISEHFHLMIYRFCDLCTV